MENKENKKIACYRLLINPNDDATEVDAISLVEQPAIKMDWFAFNDVNANPELKKIRKQEELKFRMQNAEKRMLSGVFMVPDKPIYRIDPDTGEEYFVYFTADDIENAVKKFFRQKRNTDISIEHNGVNQPGCYVVDSWFIRSEGANPVANFGFNDIPVGSWVGTVYVEDETIWNNFIKTGKVLGFSVEGLFGFGEKQLINGFNSINKVRTNNVEMDSDVMKFTEDELKLIQNIADLLSDEN